MYGDTFSLNFRFYVKVFTMKSEPYFQHKAFIVSQYFRINVDIQGVLFFD